MLLDHPDRLHTATLLCTSALGAGDDLPGPSLSLRRLWQEFDDPRDDAGEIAWRVEHWRLLNGDQTPFRAAEFRALEERVVAHTGHAQSPYAHARADVDGLDRGAELADVTVPTLVVEAPADPVHPPPHAEHLAASIGGARLVTVPGMGHALGAPVVAAVADAILTHTAAPVR
jgi:pimeloyl-ACP methyl ester carboxylesterase